MPLESQLYEADEEVQTARATAADITRRFRGMTSPLLKKYDAFLSFRGFDTRKKFTDHLYNALIREGYLIFRDEEEIEPGENIKSELREAIRNSRTSVVVLSKNYANSTACLFELQTILEFQKTSGHMILPVFYDVDPSQIKEQAEKLDFKNKTREQVDAWSAALMEIARMKGMVSQNQCNGHEAALIKDIVEFVDRKVDYTSLFCPAFERLQREYLYLRAQAEDIDFEVRREMHQIWKKPSKKVVVWLRHVESLKFDVQGLEQEVYGESRVRSPVQLRKDIEEKIQEVAELQEKGRAFKDLLVAFPIDRVLCMQPTNLDPVEARNAERIREYMRETLSVM